MALWLVIGTTLAGACTVLLLSLGSGAPWSAYDLAVLTGLTTAAVASGQFTFEFPHSTERVNYDVTDVLWIGALLLVEPEIVVVSAALGVLVGHGLRGWATTKVLFNAAQFTVAVAAAGAVLAALGTPDATRPAAWAAALAASLVFHTVNTVAIGTVVALAERVPFRETAGAQVSLLQVVGNASLAVLGALLWQVQPLAVVLLVPPVVLVYLAYRGWLRTWQERDAMRDMARTADEVARSGESGTRLPEPLTQDDANVLAVTLNRMLDRLDDSLQRERRLIRETSHELRTPITIVRGHLEVLGPDPDAQELSETTELVLDELDRMARLVEDMALLARMEDAASLRTGEVPVGRLVSSVAARAEPLLGRPLLLQGQLPSGTVRADEQRLVQALINLVGNAGTHTPDGTPIALSVSRHAHDWRFEVCDEGGGLPPDQELAVFEPFHTGGSRAAGSGLGLAIVLGIARAHGGGAGLDNRPGSGATFWISVPR